uniref:Cell surface glycoprotein n=1 Tax=uncultured haloarchaeon TaxID=160804 RepID=A0A0K1YAZ7_9EURY|nr:cell surface glycoprotein [uncultured haloarchaeon]
MSHCCFISNPTCLSHDGDLPIIRVRVRVRVRVRDRDRSNIHFLNSDRFGDIHLLLINQYRDFSISRSISIWKKLKCGYLYEISMIRRQILTKCAVALSVGLVGCSGGGGGGSTDETATETATQRQHLLRHQRRRQLQRRQLPQHRLHQHTKPESNLLLGVMIPHFDLLSESCFKQQSLDQPGVTRRLDGFVLLFYLYLIQHHRHRTFQLIGLHYGQMISSDGSIPVIVRQLGQMIVSMSVRLQIRLLDPLPQ